MDECDNRTTIHRILAHGNKQMDLAHKALYTKMKSGITPEGEEGM